MRVVNYVARSCNISSEGFPSIKCKCTWRDMVREIWGQDGDLLGDGF